MWFPVEVHSVGAVAGGLLAATSEYLRAYEHYHVVADRRLDGSMITSDHVDSIVHSLDACSVSFVGTRHMKPIGPCGAFSLALETGVAYLDHLVARDQLLDDRSFSSWVIQPVHHFVNFLFREHVEIHTVILPMSLGKPPFEGFVQTSVDERFHLTRSQ